MSLRRTSLSLLLGSLLLLACPVFADGAAANAEDASQSPMQNMVKTEILKTQAELTREIGEAHVRIRAYEAQKADVIARAKDQSRQDAEGIKLLRDYDHLLATRYVNKKGEFEPGLELSAADFEALNNLSRTHLYSLFFTGRTSAGFARRAVKTGIKQLDEMHDAHSDPTDGNNPELEIIAQLVRDDEGRVKRAHNLLDELDLKPDAQLLSQIESAGQPEAAAPDATAAKKSNKRRPAAVKGQ